MNNLFVFAGKSALAECCKHFLRECQHFLLELQSCTDCYRWQHCGEDPLWFCRPCNPRHRLVYAKQKGFPYWPAKVLTFLALGKWSQEYDYAYSNRQLIPNFELCVEIFVCRHVSMWGFRNRVCPSVPRGKKSLWLRQYQSYINNWYINEKVFTSTTAWEPKKLIFFKKKKLTLLFLLSCFVKKKKISLCCAHW